MKSAWEILLASKFIECIIILYFTLGVGTARKMGLLLDQVTKSIPVESLAVHCHDTYGQALANIQEALNVYFR